MENWGDFKRLCESWLDTPSGRGGTIALSGFLYQFLVSLDALVEKSAHDTAPTKVFLETLSDLTTVDDHCIIATQVKSTMSSSAVSSALRELWAINAKALAETPDIVTQLRYRILARQSELTDVSAAIERWRPSDDHDAAQLEAFKTKVEASVEPEPELRLARRLITDFIVSDPFGKIRAWLGELLLDPTPAGLRKSCEAIAIELAGFRHSRRELNHRFHIWGETDHPPETIEQADNEDAVLIGQIPKTSDLRAGRFASRKIYQRIHHDAEKWLADRDQSNRELLEVFWISGRSGSGKSVALLHLLTELHKANDAQTIIWLGSRAHKLADAATWARPFFDEGREVIFAADDPFSVERQEATRDALVEAEAELSDIFPSDSEAPRPSFFFCGPTEQLRTFQERLSSQVRVKGWPLAIESREDIEELRIWYRRRTGRQDLAVGDDADVLLVQLFFEWATGTPIGEFARNFRTRLMGLMPDGRLFDLVAAILALNRIYALYPSGAVNAAMDADPALGGAFDQLHETEKHFVFEEDGSGYRIAHPHIANAIYISWFGEERDWRYRKSHLQQGVTAALEHGEGLSEKFAPLWAIANLSRSRNMDDDAETRDLGQRFQSIERALQEILPELYTSKFADSALPLSDLPVWANLNAKLKLNLTPLPLDLIADAVSVAHGHATGLRLSCHTLINAFPDFERGLTVVQGLLLRMPVWIEWHPVAANYLYKGRLADIHGEVCNQVCGDAERSRPIVVAILSSDVAEEDGLRKSVTHLWIDQTEDKRRNTTRIVQSALKRWPQDPKLLAAAWRIIDEFPDLQSWSYAWEALDRAKANPARLETTGRDWLKDQSIHRGGWDRIWEHLWDRAGGDDEYLRESALGMLLDPDIQISWTHIWSKLWQSGEKRNERLRVAAAQWLEHISFDHGSWTYIWEAASADPGTVRQRLLDLGMEWLRKKPTHPTWTYIWIKSWEANSADPELRGIVHSWLKEQGEHRWWSFVWEKLFEANSADPELPGIVHSWLKEQGEHPSWSFVWGKLFEANSADPELRGIVHSWLKEQGEHPSWRFVWLDCKTAQGSEPEEQRLQIGRSWIQAADSGNAGWGFVWRGLWFALSAKADRNWLATIGMTYLNGEAVPPSSWPPVWRTIWNAGIGDTATLVRQANRLLVEKTPVQTDDIKKCLSGGRSPPGPLALTAAYQDYQWKDGWLARWQEEGSNKDALASEALNWLEQLDWQQGGWHSVWQELWQNRTAVQVDQAALRAVACDWLGRVAPEHPRWSKVWLAVWPAGESRDDQKRLGNAAGAWLSGAGRRLDWPKVWLALWEFEALRERLWQIAEKPERTGDISDEDRAVIEAKLGL